MNVDPRRGHVLVPPALTELIDARKSAERVIVHCSLEPSWGTEDELAAAPPEMANHCVFNGILEEGGQSSRCSNLKFPC